MFVHFHLKKKMMFRADTKLYSYEIISESGENVMYINYLGDASVPSLADSPQVMARTIDALSENSNITRVVLVQQRNYSYSFSQVQMLVEVASLYNFLMKQEKILSKEKLSFVEDFNLAFNTLSYIINSLLKYDPLAAYRTLKAVLVEQRVAGSNGINNKNYIWTLEKIVSYIDKLDLVKKYVEFAEQGHSETKDVYSKIFRADVMPNFTFTRMISRIPEGSEIVDQYEIATGNDKSTVTIFREQAKAKLMYHLSPPEYSLREEHHMLLNLARNVLIEHRPTEKEFSDVERTRQVFFNVARDLLQDLANSKNISLTYNDVTRLATILVRYTVGFGILEVLLQDDKLQDIAVNSPVALSPIFVRHNDYDECSSNIVVSQEDVESWAAKFRMISGRALDEANPVLDTSLNLSTFSARVAIIQQPLSIGGLAYSLRRHRDKPWTLPLFMKNKMIDGLGAGLMSFLIDGARTMIVAGTRSSGKTSLLGALMLEIMPRYRVITVEDTQELPIDAMRKLDYNILSMKVRSALTGETTEVSAEEGIRASLRLGDSSLILGEIRSEEAKALYEAMRVGALANVVAGTIHGSSPYAVFDRVVNDLGVPVTSFKATDCIVVANPVRSPDGLKSSRRVLEIAEVRKHWTKDPLAEGGFSDLMKYDVEADKLMPTDDLINGDAEMIKSIAANVKGWAGNWDAVWDNITLRQKIKEEIVSMAKKTGDNNLLEAEFTVLANDAFHRASEKIGMEIGLPMGDRVFPEWKKWLDKNVKRTGL
jgi:type IV secretory pathway ATPase VirB11/archaellum biosynthesis ATPase